MALFTSCWMRSEGETVRNWRLYLYVAALSTIAIFGGIGGMYIDMKLWPIPKPSAELTSQDGLRFSRDSFAIPENGATFVKPECPETLPNDLAIGEEVKEVKPCAWYWCVGCESVKGGKIVRGRAWEMVPKH